MKKIVIGLLLALLSLGVLKATADTYIIGGHWVPCWWDENVGCCTCDGTSLWCVCITVIEPKPRQCSLADYLRGLPSYKGEDDTYFYFRCKVDQQDTTKFLLNYAGNKGAALSKAWVEEHEND